VGHLAERVNPGVGAARAAHAHLLARKSRDRLDEFALDGGALGLHLPTDERRSIVLEGDSIAGHIH
jgi:hypothetical protein